MKHFTTSRASSRRGRGLAIRVLVGLLAVLLIAVVLPTHSFAQQQRAQQQRTMGVEFDALFVEDFGDVLIITYQIDRRDWTRLEGHEVLADLELSAPPATVGDEPFEQTVALDDRIGQVVADTRNLVADASHIDVSLSSDGEDIDLRFIRVGDRRGASVQIELLPPGDAPRLDDEIFEFDELDRRDQRQRPGQRIEDQRQRQQQRIEDQRQRQQQRFDERRQRQQQRFEERRQRPQQRFDERRQRRQQRLFNPEQQSSPDSSSESSSESPSNSSQQQD